MGLKATLDLAHGALAQEGIPHALIGGLALSFLGAQRSTADIDFLVDGTHAAKARAALFAVGFTPFHESPEVLQLEGVGPLDLLFAHRSLSLAMLARATPLAELGGLACVQAEDLIGLKIQAYRNNTKRALQDKADIQRLMAANPDLDMAQVYAYARLFNETEEMERLWTIARTPE